jgi:hypothetical protein
MAEVLEYYTQKVTASSRHRCQCSRCSGSSATRLAKYQSPQLQAIAVQQTPETELARKSDAELFENLQARAAALGFTIERIRPQLTLVDGSKQDERA